MKEMQTAEFERTDDPRCTSKKLGVKPRLKPGDVFASIGRLKPPSSTVAPAFFSGL